MFEMILGIAGTAKNTGKTTTTAAIMNALRMRGINYYLTSIGYDGENIDNITGLPKPKLRVEAGDMLATAEKCLTVSTARFETITETDIRTPLGKIIVVKAIQAGLAVTAGPNKSAEVRKLAEILRQYGPAVTLLDGALNRIAPMVETNGFILATGASKTPDIPRLAQETGLIWRISNLPPVLRAADVANLKLDIVSVLDANLRVLHQWPCSSLLTEADAIQATSRPVPAGGYLVIPGIITEKALARLAEQFQNNPQRIQLTLSDPIKLLVAGNPIAYYSYIEQLDKSGLLVGVIKRVPMIATTINPFYPEYRVENNTYKPAYVDPVRLQVSIQRQVSVPVFNVMKQGVSGLVDLILANAQKWEGPKTVYF